MFRWLPATIVALSAISACSHDWDAFDPRLGSSGGGGGGGGVPATTTGTTGANMTVSSGSTTSSTSSTMSSTSMTTGDGGGGSGPGQVTYGAAVADCINPGAPDPDACAAEVQMNRMTCDTEFDAMNDPTPRHIYLRFDLDGVLSGKTVDAVNVRLRVPMTSGSDSDQTGDMYEVDPFDRADLFTAAPANVGASPISANMGTVAQGDQVFFPLPSSAVTANGSVYLGILPLSTDGVDYYNNLGAEPPALVIDYH